MTISSLALAAKKVIDAAWLHGDTYDLSSQAAFALESTGMLQSPETAAELESLRERLNAAPAELSPEQRAALNEQLGDAKPATTGLIQRMAEAVHNRAVHEHPTWEDLYCFNLTSWLGERMAPVLRRLLDAEARVSELEVASTTAYRAEHPDSGITLGHYGTEAAARAHCEATERRSWPTGTMLVFGWIEDDEDRVAELVVTAGQNEESTTGYLVTVLELDSEYDEGADQ